MTHTADEVPRVHCIPRVARLESLERRTLLAAAPPAILFVRGAPRSGGFLSGHTDADFTSQLSDINDTSTAPDSRGWGTLAATLRGAGFDVQQIIEPTESGAPAKGHVNGARIRFEKMNLSKYAAIVFGSNNASYPKKSVDAVVKYVQAGGGALFISDGNFGSNWRDAP